MNAAYYMYPFSSIIYDAKINCLISIYCSVFVNLAAAG